MMNNRGILTVDYLFAFFLVSGFSLIIITFSVTMSTVEVVQYMTFASARNYFAGNVNEEAQKESARRKFFTLKSNAAFGPLLNNGWFSVPDESFIVDYNIPDKYSQYAGYSPSAEGAERNVFHGVAVSLVASILNFSVPFFGSTAPTQTNDDAPPGYFTNITSFLGREPSFDECLSFSEQRWEQIQKLDVPFGAPYSQANSVGGYVVMNDNGC